ncbi:hypothetical protein LCGC14_1477390 [marine sediment metagenome]|uniref:Uncharacterized protein n=1 Tax=marine sediment metagenome TaxID=412755 RepID=A0A0F9JAM1_9ZZZZ
MNSKRLRQADKELIEAKEALANAQDRLTAANQEVSEAMRIKYPIRTNLNFSRSKDENWDEATHFGLDDGGDNTGAARHFVYEVLNLNVGVEIGEGGKVTILSVNNVMLDTPIEMS